MGTSIREAKHQIDVGLFLDEYPWWELGTPHWSVILHEMFLHAANRGWKEAECMFHWDHWGSTMGPNLQVVLSAMELVGYWTSCKEIWDIYQIVYLLWRLPGLPFCGNEQRKRTIWNICSSLKVWMHRHGYPATTGEDSEQEEEQWPGPSRSSSGCSSMQGLCAPLTGGSISFLYIYICSGVVWKASVLDWLGGLSSCYIYIYI